jgi:hypothetical protein
MAPMKILIALKLINLKRRVPKITPVKVNGKRLNIILASKNFLFKYPAIKSQTINNGIRIAIALTGP